NVSHRRVKMDALRGVYVDAGFANVATYIATGNVIFDSHSPPLVDDLETRFCTKIGFPSQVFLRTADEVRGVVAAKPWTHDGALVDVSFLERLPEESASRQLERSVTLPESLVVDGYEVFFLREGKGIPTVHKESSTVGTLGMQTTRRGMTTVERIAARFFS
ncbi:MAG: DUF1697 domain-containing protein, partial [Acidimicrobiia bacterium]